MTLLELTLHQMFCAFRTIVQCEEERPSHSNCLGTETQCFEDVSAAPEAAVDVDLHLIEDLRALFVQFEEDQDGRWAKVKIAA